MPNRIISFASVLVPCLLLAACADQADDPAPEAAPAIVDHGDGTFSYANAEGRDQSTTQQRGALTYAYAGQARYAWVPTPKTKLEYDVAPPASTSEIDELGMLREDEDGSLWKVTGIEMDTLRAQFAAHAAGSEEVALGLDAERPFLRKVPLVEEPVGTHRTIEAHSWSNESCGNHFYMNDDDRAQVSPTGSPRRKAVVEIRVNGATQCTGTILRSQWVLTAAHCLFDANDVLIPRSQMTVKRWDGVDSSNLTLVNRFIDSGFTSPGVDPKDDWALLKLTSALVAPFEDMDISSASDSTLNGLAHANNIAFPQFAPECDNNDIGGTVDAMWNNTAGELGALYSEKVNFKIDGGPGHSGSPVFYCPASGDGSCSGTDAAFVIAVWSGWNGFETTMVGAKGASHHDSAIATMDNN